MFAQDVYQDWAILKGTQNFFLKSIVKTDASRNVYQAGATFTADGNYDVILSKSDYKGNELWTATYDNGDNLNDAAVDIQLDSGGNIYVAGTTVNPNNSGYQVLLLKYSSGGNLLWHLTYSFPGSLYNVATSVTLDNNRVYIGGITYNAQNEADFLALSYTHGGSFNWKYAWNNVSLNDDITVIYKKGNDLYLAGGTEIAQGKWKYCVQELNPTNGSLTGQSINGGSGDGIDRIADLTRDDNGNVYVTGGVANLNSGYDFKTI